MFTDKFREVLENEGVVTVLSWGVGEPHIVNTWNSFIVTTEDNRILIPAWAYRKTEENIKTNNNIKISLGSKKVKGYKDYPGTGFIIKGTGKFISEGSDYNMMKAKFSFLTRVLEVSVLELKQML